MFLIPEIQHLAGMPGYKPIMRGLVKSIMIQLMEELAVQTGEETVLLAACLQDGTVTGFGSGKGKIFLDERDDIKVQFLDFCRKKGQGRKRAAKSAKTPKPGKPAAVKEQPPSPPPSPPTPVEGSRPKRTPKPTPKLKELAISLSHPSPAKQNKTPAPGKTEATEKQLKAASASTRTMTRSAVSTDLATPRSTRSQKTAAASSQSKQEFNLKSKSPRTAKQDSKQETKTAAKSKSLTPVKQEDKESDDEDMEEEENALLGLDDSDDDVDYQPMEDDSDIEELNLSNSLESDKDDSDDNQSDNTASQSSYMADQLGLNAVKSEKGDDSSTVGSEGDGPQKKTKRKTGAKEADQTSFSDWLSNVIDNTKATDAENGPQTSSQSEEPQEGVATGQSPVKIRISRVEKEEFSPSDLDCTIEGVTVATPTNADYIRQLYKREGRQKPVVCEQCGKSFKTVRQYKEHVIDHTGEQRKFPCAFCAKRFKRKRDMLTHQALHSKPPRSRKIYMCNICNREYRTSKQLLEHSFDHTDGPKPFPCDLCEKTFKRKKSMMSHRLVHLKPKKEKPDPTRVCEICGKFYKGVKQYREHMMNHTGEKRPHTCEVCHKGFKRRNEMNAHYMARHLNQANFKCKVCGVGYKWPKKALDCGKRHEAAKVKVKEEIVEALGNSETQEIIIQADDTTYAWLMESQAGMMQSEGDNKVVFVFPEQPEEGSETGVEKDEGSQETATSVEDAEMMEAHVDNVSTSSETVTLATDVFPGSTAIVSEADMETTTVEIYMQDSATASEIIQNHQVRIGNDSATAEAVQTLIQVSQPEISAADAETIQTLMNVPQI